MVMFRLMVSVRNGKPYKYIPNTLQRNNLKKQKKLRLGLVANASLNITIVLLTKYIHNKVLIIIIKIWVIFNVTPLNREALDVLNFCIFLAIF